jgi:hypothetical protein
MHCISRCAVVEEIGVDKSRKARSQFHDGYSTNEAGEDFFFAVEILMHCCDWNYECPSVRISLGFK